MPLSEQLVPGLNIHSKDRNHNYSNGFLKIEFLDWNCIFVCSIDKQKYHLRITNLTVTITASNSSCVARKYLQFTLVLIIKNLQKSLWAFFFLSYIRKMAGFFFLCLYKKLYIWTSRAGYKKLYMNQLSRMFTALLHMNKSRLQNLVIGEQRAGCDELVALESKNLRLFLQQK